jgi:hypothetical protein
MGNYHFPHDGTAYPFASSRKTSLCEGFDYVVHSEKHS